MVSAGTGAAGAARRDVPAPDEDPVRANRDVVTPDEEVDRDVPPLDEDAVRAGHAALVDAAVRAETAAEGQRRLSHVVHDLDVDHGIGASLRRPPVRLRYPRWGWRESVRFAVEHRMTRVGYLSAYRRWVWHRARIAATRQEVVLHGIQFIGRRVELRGRPDHGRLVVGPWSHLGNDNKLRAHEGQLSVGAKVVLGRDNVVNTYLDVEIGDAAILADWIYVCDFDHRTERLDVPIKDQGIIASPTRIGADVWVGEKSSVLRGVDVGRGSVIASHCLVNRDVPPFSIAVGVPVRVVRSRLPQGMDPEEAAALVERGLPIPGDPIDD